MKVRIVTMTAALLLAGLVEGSALAASAPAAGLLGVWRTEDTSQVTVSACPEGFCGVLTHVAMAPASYAKLSAADRKAVDAQDPRQFPDTKNQDAKLRGRSLVGLKMFVVKATGKPDTFDGTLYNPQDGGTYDGNIRIENANQLLLSGCLFKVLCRSQEWNRIVPSK